MSIPGLDAVARFQANEDRFNTFLNTNGTYLDSFGNPVETLPSLANTIVGMTLTVVFLGNWATSTVYNRNQVVKFSDNKNYICKLAHTSGTFAIDLAANKWQLYENVLLQDLKNQSFVNISDHNDDIAAAIAALPSTGGTVFLDAKTYVSPYQNTSTTVPSSLVMMSKDNVRLVGAGMPIISSDNSHLIGGTIIQGPFFYMANGFQIENMGFDSGADFCNTYKAGVVQEGLIGWDMEQVGGGAQATRYGLKIENVVTLCKNPGTAALPSDVHSCLIENYEGFEVRNLVTRLGGAGLVIKSSNGLVDGHRGSGHFKYSGLIKSEGYKQAKAIRLANLEYRSLAIASPNYLNATDYDTSGLVIQASSADAVDITCVNVITDGVINPFLVQGLSTNQCADITIFGLQAKNSYTSPVATSNICNRVRVFGLISRGSGDGVVIGSQSTDCSISGYVQGANNYSISNSGVGTSLPDFYSVSPAAGTGGLRSLAGDVVLGNFQHYNPDTTTPVVIVGGSVYGPGGVVNIGNPATWAYVDATGHIIFGGTTVTNNALLTVMTPTGRVGTAWKAPTTSAEYVCDIQNPNGRVGLISCAASATTYATSSDYRLKENVETMAGALDRVKAMRPVTFNWKVDGSKGEGFIAHELQAIVPQAVVGEKDAERDGEPDYQAVDQSHIVSILTAAIKELDTKVENILKYLK